MPTHKSVREILEELFISGMNFEDIYWRTPENMKTLDQALSSLADLILAEKKYLKGSDSPQDKYLEQMNGWNSAIDHLVKKIKE